ncbi:MAG: hypothetical protein ACKPKF_22775 [Microcystis panniformis]
MPLELPNLDDRTYEDLVAEALRLIPNYAPEWTNYNPSDPGITLIEMFAYLTEILLYRQNRITDHNLRTFLRLLNGPDWFVEQNQNLAQVIRDTVLNLRDEYRAITAEDYEILSQEKFNIWLVQMQQEETAGKPLKEWWETTNLEIKEENLPSKVSQKIRRAHCVPQRYLGAGREEEKKQSKPNYVSVMILPDKDSDSANQLGPQPTTLLRDALQGYLQQRSILTTRLSVVGPSYTPVSAEILVARRSDVLTETVSNGIVKAMQQFLDPENWPFGRDVHVSEVYELLEKIDGIDYLTDVLLVSKCQPEDQHCLATDTIWNDQGEPIGLRLYDHYLPVNRLKLSQIVIAPSANFLAVQLIIKVRAASGANLDLLKREIKSQTRAFFHPLYPTIRELNPLGVTDMKIEVTTDQTIKLSSLQLVDSQYLETNSLELNLATIITGIAQVTSIQLSSDRNQEGGWLLIKAGEVIDLRSQVEVD